MDRFTTNVKNYSKRQDGHFGVSFDLFYTYYVHKRIFILPKFQRNGRFPQIGQCHFTLFTALKHCTKFWKNQMHGFWEKAVIYGLTQGRKDWHNLVQGAAKKQSNATTLILRLTSTSWPMSTAGSWHNGLKKIAELYQLLNFKLKLFLCNWYTYIP